MLHSHPQDVDGLVPQHQRLACVHIGCVVCQDIVKSVNINGQCFRWLIKNIPFTLKA